MSPWLLYLAGAIYLGVAVQYILSGRYGMSLAFAAYAIASIWFALDMR